MENKTQTVEDLKKEYQSRFSNDERALYYEDADDPTPIGCGDDVWEWFNERFTPNSQIQQSNENYLKCFAVFCINEEMSHIHGATQDQYDEMIEKKRKQWVDKIEQYKLERAKDNE